ncbi:MAG: Lrp/AsnC family transcriptional regulator [Crocinitomicaceae bacterium]|jgi:DNA-binding Lrp family transcriptional regulator|nr:Lrp/AsnC family transcriptional regulator [Crocinitomicaceae bacterium]MBK9590593.1 Lrp/AsnC family transcriptional regulator [Crocinitomicaceae bacterium]
MDQIDLKILDLLQGDAKITAKDLSNRLSLSVTPIYERIRKLEKQGIIKNYVAIIDPEMVNKSLVVFLNLTIKEHNMEARSNLLRSLTSLDEISELYHTSGTYDFVAKVRFSSIKEYKDFLVNKVASIENIADIESHIVLEEIKHSTRINLT